MPFKDNLKCYQSIPMVAVAILPGPINGWSAGILAPDGSSAMVRR